MMNLVEGTMKTAGIRLLSDKDLQSLRAIYRRAIEEYY